MTIVMNVNRIQLNSLPSFEQLPHIAIIKKSANLNSVMERISIFRQLGDFWS
jgi:hypothetical protein